MKIVGTAIISDKNGRILIGKRPEGKDLAGLWEFPGGKQEQGETVEQCIVREIREELAVCCFVGDFFMQVEKSYPHGTFRLMVYRAKLAEGEIPVPQVHQELKWVTPEELDNYEFPPADVDIVARLQREKYSC